MQEHGMKLENLFDHNTDLCLWSACSSAGLIWLFRALCYNLCWPTIPTIRLSVRKSGQYLEHRRIIAQLF